MELTVSNLEKSSKEIKAKLDENEVEGYFKSALKNIGRNATVPGFRKGKAPDSVLAARLGNSLKTEVFENIVKDCYKEAREREKFVPVAEAKISPDDVLPERGKPFELKMQVDVKPEINPPDYGALVIEREKAEITEEMVDAAFKREQEEYAGYIPANDRAVKKGDLVVVEGEQLAGGRTAAEIPRVSIPLGEGRMPEELERGLEGLRTGEEKEITVSQPEGEGVSYRLKVVEIKEKRMIHLNDDFAKTAGYAGTEEWREDIRSRLEERVKANIEGELRKRAADNLVDSAVMELPESMVKLHEQYLTELSKSLRDGGGPDAVKIREMAERRVKENFLVEEIAARENITVDDAEVEREAGASSGGGGSRADRDELRYFLKRRKVLDFVVSKARIREKEEPVILDPDKVNLVSKDIGGGEGGSR